MSGAAARARLPLILSTAVIRTVLAERGLRESVVEENRLVAEYPVRPARRSRDSRKAIVLTRDDEGNWRGALLVSTAPRCWELVDQERRFRDLLHVAMWIRAHESSAVPAQPPRIALTLREVH